MPWPWWAGLAALLTTHGTAVPLRHRSSSIRKADGDAEELNILVDDLERRSALLNQSRIELQARLETEKEARNDLERRLKQSHVDAEERLAAQKKEYQAAIQELMQKSQKSSLTNKKKVGQLMKQISALEERVLQLSSSHAGSDSEEDVEDGEAVFFTGGKERSTGGLAAGLGGEDEEDEAARAVVDLRVSPERFTTRSQLSALEAENRNLSKQVLQLNREKQGIKANFTSAISSLQKKVKRETAIKDAFEAVNKNLTKIIKKAIGEKADTVKELKQLKQNQTALEMNHEAKTKNLTSMLTQLRAEKDQLQKQADAFKEQFDQKDEAQRKTVQLVDELKQKIVRREAETAEIIKAATQPKAKHRRGR